MQKESSWKTTWRYVVGVAICLFFGYFAFVRGVRVPLLGWADLGFHELGHFIMYPLPVGQMTTAAAGSGLQVLVPVGLAVYFLAFRKDLLGGGICAAWAGASLQDVSIYIADAPYERLPLIGGEHDWAFLLGPEQFDALDKAQGIANVVKGVGIVLLLVGIGLCLAGPLVSWRPKASPRGVQLGPERSRALSQVYAEAAATQRVGNILPGDPDVGDGQPVPRPRPVRPQQPRPPPYAPQPPHRR